MADDPNVVPRSAILQSITTEASGFYTTVTTIASTFLGASLLFADRFLTNGSNLSRLFLPLAWISLVTSLVCIAVVRFWNLKSGQLALQGKDEAAAAIDVKSWKVSATAQWSLIVGMAALVVVGLANIDNFGKKENAVLNLNNPPSPQTEQKTIPYGSLKPNTTPVQTPAPTTTQPSTSTPPPTSQPKK